MVNKVILMGRLGANPELKYTPGGAAVCNFSMATEEKWKDKGGEQQTRTEWHKIVVWGKLAEICGKYLEKGSMAFIEGSVHTRQWQDKEGQTRYTTEVNAREMRMVGNRPRSDDPRGNDNHVDNDGGEYGYP